MVLASAAFADACRTPCWLVDSGVDGQAGCCNESTGSSVLLAAASAYSWALPAYACTCAPETGLVRSGLGMNRCQQLVDGQAVDGNAFPGDVVPERGVAGKSGMSLVLADFKDLNVVASEGPGVGSPGLDGGCPCVVLLVDVLGSQDNNVGYSLYASASPRANEPNTMMLIGEGDNELAASLRRSRVMSRERARSTTMGGNAVTVQSELR